MNRKAFTLIELLVVVAIIGILAAVGVVAYNGYTGAAKVSAIKSNFKTVSKYISAELMKCQIGHENIFINSGNRKVSCSAVQDAPRLSGAVPFDPSLTFLNPIDNGIWNRDRQIAVRNDVYKGSSIPDNMIGYIYYNFNAWPSNLRSCFKLPCSKSENILTTTLNYQ